MAVKMLLRDSSSRRDDFLEEIRLTARLDHLNLVKLIGASVIDGKPVAVFERMKTDLLKFLQQRKQAVNEHDEARHLYAGS